MSHARSWRSRRIPEVSDPSDSLDVAIVGAGLAGLTAAAVLCGMGARVLVLEAGRRPGGRIDAVRDPRTGAALADLGPTWIWPDHQPAAAGWVGRLGLRLFAQHDAGDAALDGFAPGVLRQPLPGQHGIARIGGGPAALIAALAGRLPPRAIRLGAPAAEISAAPGGVAITLADGKRILAARAILAAPLRVAAQTIALPGANPALLAAMRATPTWMAAQAKVAVLYDAPFWREAGLSGRIASRTGPLAEAHDHCPAEGGPAALFGFIGWPVERRRADPQGLRTAILGQLVRCLGPRAADPLRMEIADWADNPLICATADLTGPPRHPEPGPAILRAGHLGGRLHLAVSETCAISPGLIEGALIAGERAARAEGSPSGSRPCDSCP